MENDPKAIILAGIVHGGLPFFFRAKEKLAEGTLAGAQAQIFETIDKVHSYSNQVADDAAFRRIISRAKIPPQALINLEEEWDRTLSIPRPSEPEFEVALQEAMEDFKNNTLNAALTEAMTISVSNNEDLSPEEATQKAMEILRQKLATVEEVGAENLPEFNIRDQKEDIIREFEEGEQSQRLPTGIRPLDEFTGGGIGLGELWLPVAGTGVGKSMFCTNVAHAFMLQGKNVVYFTTETLFRQIRHRILIRHTMTPELQLDEKITSFQVKHNQMTEDQRVEWLKTIDDFSDNPEYGQLTVIQIADGTKMSTVEAKLYRQHLIAPVDLCIIDSADMLSPEHRRTEELHNLNEVVNKCKSLAVSFDNQRGTRVLAPWQTSRRGQEEAQQTGRYTKRALSDTSMAEKRADLVLALLEDPATPSKLKAQTLKFRDAQPVDFEMTVDYSRAYMGSNASVEEATGSLTSEIIDSQGSYMA